MLLTLLLACGPGSDPAARTPLTLSAGAPVAGVAEVPIDFPVGAPMGGYSSRCDYLGGDGSVDKRQSAYALAFSSSAGIQTRPMAKALWLENGDQHLVVLKADVIYSYDGMVEELEARLSEATGVELNGRIMLTTSHTHNAPANYSDQIHFYLGGDRYNEEVFRRFATSLEAAALSAYEGRVDAKIGMGIATDWDPDDRVYADRREQNDDLQVWDDAPAGYGKDPHLYVLRVDDLNDNPLGVFFNFGIHGTSLGGNNAMISTDSSGGLEGILEERFDTPVVVAHLQGAGGDAAPQGTSAHGHEYARMEGIGEFAVDAIHDLWSATPTSDASLTLDSVGHSIPQALDTIQVTRDGTVDWYYAPYNEDEEFAPDDLIYDTDGSILSPIDEFNAQYGGVFCGYDDPLISSGTIGSQVPPYDGCMNVELISFVINGIFGLDEFWEGGEAPLPLPSSEQAGTAAALLSPLSILNPDGTTTSEDFLVGFFPGETTAMYTEQFRRRAAAELGLSQSMVVGYAQDHEGYLLIPEDWLIGGYEPNINLWGPLQGEHIMEGVLLSIEEHLLTETLEPQDPLGIWQPTDYPVRDLPGLAPDDAPAAGTALTSLPEYIYTPLDLAHPDEAKDGDALIAIAPEAVVPRVQGMVQFAWEGGDPGVDMPLVILERQDGGEWIEVTTAAGRPITGDLPDILLTLSSDPLYPYDDAQSHIWWAAWQAVGHVHDRAGLPEGTYRLHVYGKTYAGGATEWPWPTDDYELTTDPFEVTPAQVSISVDEGSVSAWISGPSAGYRLVDVDGSAQGSNPVHEATLSWTFADDSIELDDAAGTISGGVTTFTTSPPADAVGVEITDMYGNTGWMAL
ncbi:MAG: neutral/alkaline non-lysosomal ceramidase N-terminal domain-containing protein [Myxococcota bacterium]|nr:neutral/alkaline non-lysosomal ceramidase N-terminal domain-containing protein [Myxococcota bacterium]